MFAVLCVYVFMYVIVDALHCFVLFFNLMQLL